MELAHQTPTREMLAVSVETKPRATVSEPRLLFNMDELHLRDGEPLPDGGWIAVQQGPEEYGEQQIAVVQNWFVELEHALASQR
jgi:hypothetical protein